MILFTSDTKSYKAAKTAFIYVVISIFCAIFGFIYELFSHGVYSYGMIYSFLYPLAGGALPYLVLFFIKKAPYPSAAVGNLYHGGIAACTVGSIVYGVLEIYGTTNALSGLYFTVGIPLILFGALVYAVSCIRANKKIDG